MPSKPRLSAYSSWSMYSWYTRLPSAGSYRLESMSTQTERCVWRKSSGRCGQGMRLNQVNFTGILPGVTRLRAPILLALVGAALAAPAARAENIFLDVDTPHSGDLVREPLGLCEVKGWTGTGLRGKHDVVVVLDRSGSTFRSSGMD